MGKGIVKGISTGGGVKPVKTTTIIDSGSGTNPSRDTTYDASDPVGMVMEGIIDDNGVDVNFQQPFGAELGLEVGSKVNFNYVNIGGRNVANCVRLVERGIIETVNATDDGGTLYDRGLRRSIPFLHPFCKASLIQAPVGGGKGSVVTFERIVDPRTAVVTATALEVK